MTGLQTGLLLTAFLTTNMVLQAAPRLWKSADGSQTILADVVRRDAQSVVLKRTNPAGVITLPLERLHVDEILWLNEHHPLAALSAESQSAWFDQVMPGDSRAQVMEKLKASTLVELTVAETFVGRTGMNGVFRTRMPQGGLHATLDFDWGDDGCLRELTLQSEAVSQAQASERLKPCRDAWVALLTEIYGKPVFAQPGFSLTHLPDTSLVGSHLWKLKPKGSLMLGPSRNGDSYSIVIRFMEKDVNPVALP